MPDPYVLTFILLLVVLLIVIAYRSKIVPEFEQVVIYRLGRFHRLAGPGMIFYNRLLDTIQQTIDVREKRQTLPISGMFVYDIPFGFTLNVWMQFDPRQIAATDPTELTRLTHIAENERLGNVRSEVKRALQNALAQVQEKHPLPLNPNIFHKLLPIIPGGEVCKEMLVYLRHELNQSLSNVGFLLSPQQEITIVDFNLNADIIDIFNRGRLAKSLREDIPTISDDQVFDFLAKVKGLDIDVKRIFMDGGDHLDMRLRDEDRELDIRIPRDAYSSRQQRRPATADLGPPPWETKRQAAKAGAAARSTIAEQATAAKSASPVNSEEPGLPTAAKVATATDGEPVSADSHSITLPTNTISIGDDDWRVMKRVPRLQTSA